MYYSYIRKKKREHQPNSAPCLMFGNWCAKVIRKCLNLPAGETGPHLLFKV